MVEKNSIKKNKMKNYYGKSEMPPFDFSKEEIQSTSQVLSQNLELDSSKKIKLVFFKNLFKH